MKKKSNLSTLMKYAGKYKVLTYLSWVLSGISALVALVPFIYIWKIIKEILDNISDLKNAENLAYYGWMAVIFSVLAILIYIGALMCSHFSAFRVQANLRKTMTYHITTLPLGKIESFGSGKLRSIINESSGATETYLAHQLPDMVNSFVTPIALLFMLLFFDWRLGLLSLIPVVLAFVIMATMTGKRMQKKMEEYQNALNDMSNEAVEYVRGIPVVKTFGQSVFSFKRFKGAIDRCSKWAISYTKELRFPMIIYTMLINGVFAFLIGGTLFFTRDTITTEFILNLIFYIIITPIISVTLTKTMHASENNQILNDAMNRINSVLELEPLSSSTTPQSPKDGSVELKNIYYSYDGKKKALNNVSLKINSGETVAFVGPSGGGKSTLANIIARFFDPNSGEVLIGNINSKDIPKEELMNTVSFVFQNSRLIKGTIYDNVKLGKENATKEEVLSALQKAQCMDIIDKLPNGIDTLIGTNGIYLSGGECQRIVIARAILKDSPIVILDEATAFADPDNETKVQQAFNTLSKGKTVIMIAHRLSTVINADKIFVINNGEIAESGSSEELINSNGFFSSMWKNYQTSVNWKVKKEVVK